ncbi:nitroreductase family protein [Bauldia litoralis]|uniref:nitroreductase family protein n=1 Tax=Bauldia litoralis TaxID=665467 RepID=UPI003267B69A
MDALELLKTRRSITAPFLGAPGPDQAQLDDILTIASRVPDHGKLAPWRFIVFQGEARLAAGEALAALYRRQNPEADAKRIEDERVRLARAPLVIGVVSRAAPHPKIPEFEQLLSAGNAAMLAVMAAHALGFAAHWVTEWISYDAEAGRILGLREGEKFVGFVHVGTPTVPPADRPRPDLADIVDYWRPSPGAG